MHSTNLLYRHSTWTLHQFEIFHEKRFLGEIV